jgi:hypothetical protein
MRTTIAACLGSAGIVALLGVPGSMPAQAQALPGWKIADICAKESTPGQCAAFEGRAHNAVSASWSFVLEPIRESCLKQTSAPPDQSWRLLAECIDNATLRALDKSAVRTVRTPAEPVPPPRAPVPPPAADLAPPPAAEPPKAQ